MADVVLVPYGHMGPVPYLEIQQLSFLGTVLQSLCLIYVITCTLARPIISEFFVQLTLTAFLLFSSCYVALYNLPLTFLHL